MAFPVHKLPRFGSAGSRRSVVSAKIRPLRLTQPAEISETIRRRYQRGRLPTRVQFVELFFTSGKTTPEPTGLEPVKHGIAFRDRNSLWPTGFTRVTNCPEIIFSCCNCRQSSALSLTRIVPKCRTRKNEKGGQKSCESAARKR